MRIDNVGVAALKFAAGVILFAIAATGASAAPFLVVDAATGRTLVAHDATEPWYPASLTKLMTTYVALEAAREGRLTMDTPLTMSVRASRMAPSKMGFAPGVEVTLDNALKMLMVKSPNDVAAMIAESIDGSIENFADEMNATGRKLGLQESHFDNPNGLPDPGHYSSARDLAIIARALLSDFPEHADLYGIGAMELDGAVIPNHNRLLGRFPGADGMKTGFTCAAGFNIVATATRNGRKLIAVVLGSPTSGLRNLEAAEMLERSFAEPQAAGPALADLPRSEETAPKDMRSVICSRRDAAALAEAEEEIYGEPAAPAAPVAPSPPHGRAAIAAAAPASAWPASASPSPDELIERGPVQFDPVPVFVGPKPGWTGPVLAARPEPGAPSEVNAYSTAAAPSAAVGGDAPLALQGALKPSRAVIHLPPRRTFARMTPQRWRAVVAAQIRMRAKKLPRRHQ